jgi:hypothetical protein
LRDFFEKKISAKIFSPEVNLVESEGYLKSVLLDLGDQSKGAPKLQLIPVIETSLLYRLDDDLVISTLNLLVHLSKSVHHQELIIGRESHHQELIIGRRLGVIIYSKRIPPKSVDH